MNTLFHTPPARRSGFTLVELLVVIGIIAVLAAILLPAMNAAFTKAEKSQAQTEVRSLLAAIQAYNNEYGKMPVPNNMQGNGDDAVTGLYPSNTCALIIKALNGIHDASAAGVPNPRKITFLDAQGGSANGGFVDPWGMQYLMKLDTDYNGQVNYTGATYRTVGVVVSYGTDGISGGEIDILAY